MSRRRRRTAFAPIEVLEVRRLLTIVMQPIFGAETAKQGNGDTLDHPAINIIFWGSQWQGLNGPDSSQWNSALDTDAQQLVDATEKLINSNYLDITKQYGADPSGIFVNDVVWDSDNAPQTFDTDDINQVVGDKIGHGLPEPKNQENGNGDHILPIYVVVTPPGIVSNDSEAGGFNSVPLDIYFPDLEYTPEIWVSTNDNGNNISVDSYTRFLGHEIAEITTDYKQDGYEVNTPPDWTLGGDDQIADKEGNFYSYRMPDGIDVQPLWSAQDNSWIITDGNSQLFNLQPLWNGTSFTGRYNLFLAADQNFSNFNDNVVLGTDAAGGLAVTLDGETVNFDANYIANVQIDTGIGTNTIEDDGTPLSTHIHAFSTFGSINLTTTVRTVWSVVGNGNVDINFDTFANVANITGGPQQDTFNFAPGGSIPGNIDGGTGAQNNVNYDFDFTAPVITNTTTDTTTGVGGTFANISTFNDDVTTQNNAPPNATFIGSGHWDILGPNDGDNEDIFFENYPKLVGGGQNDTFKFQNASPSIGSIDGGAGLNTIDYSQYLQPVFVSLLGPSATGIGSFTNIQSFIANTFEPNILTGPSASSTWTLNGVAAGSVAGYNFSGFNTLDGGNGDDRFQFQAFANIQTISAGGGTNTLDYSALPGPITANFQIGNATDVFQFFNITNLIGSQSNADTIIGPDASWLITGANAGSVNGITYSSIENLTGSPQTDTFSFKPGGSVSGNVNGGGGTDTLDYSALPSAVSINPATGKATGIGGTFSNITAFNGGTGGVSITPPTGPATWTISGPNTVSAFGFTFTHLPSITAGSGNDTFLFLPAGKLDGKIDGGGGVNTLSYAALTANLTINLSLNSAPNVTGGIFNIQNVVGAKGNNLLVGDASNNTLTGGSGRNILIGEKGADTLTGGGGDNILIGGSTVWDKNPAALAGIFAEWSRTDQSLLVRIVHLSGLPGGLNSKYDLLPVLDVVSDTSRDTLIGTKNFDWFFPTFLQDVVSSGLNLGDLVTLLGPPYL